MTLHKEGRNSILLALILFIILNATSFYFIPSALTVLSYTIFLLLGAVLFIVVYFFRMPNRRHNNNPNILTAPADGKVVVIEEVFEEEFLKTKCRQISIFMSPLNVHVNRYPQSGNILYYKYHKGKYLVAWHPKSSTENERTTIALENENKDKILIRQIAGALARRIVCYTKENTYVKQNEELGFIKFGSRVDVFVPLSYEVLVDLNQKTVGGITEIARIK
ncbi:MAG: phosphatidylserine decarboxylase family protein [Bacteroidota bacterium]